MKQKTVEPLFTATPEPKKHSTMEDVFAGMNRHAKKESSKESNQAIKERTKIPEAKLTEVATRDGISTISESTASLIDHFDAMV